MEIGESIRTDKGRAPTSNSTARPLTGWPPEQAMMCVASSPHGCHEPHTALEPVCGADGSSPPSRGRWDSRRGQDLVHPRNLPSLFCPCLLDGLQHDCW